MLNLVTSKLSQSLQADRLPNSSRRHHRHVGGVIQSMYQVELVLHSMHSDENITV